MYKTQIRAENIPIRSAKCKVKSLKLVQLSTFQPSTFNFDAPDPDNAGVGNGLWSLTNVESTPTVGRFN